MHSYNKQGRLYKNYKLRDFRVSEYCDRAYHAGHVEKMHTFFFLESSPLSEAMIRINVYYKQGTFHQNIIYLLSYRGRSCDMACFY